jgi:hypothetical protein
MQEGDSMVNCFRKDVKGTLWFKDRLVVPKKEALKKKILDETHTSIYSIHPGSTKMYHDLRQQFWWTWMKRKTARYLSECDTCRKVKADYMKMGGLFQPKSIRIGSGKTLAWTSLWSYLRLATRLTRYGWLLIDSPSLATLSPCTPASQLRSM